MTLGLSVFKEKLLWLTLLPSAQRKGPFHLASLFNNLSGSWGGDANPQLAIYKLPFVFCA